MLCGKRCMSIRNIRIQLDRFIKNDVETLVNAVENWKVSK